MRNNNLLFVLEWPFEIPQTLKQTHTNATLICVASIIGLEPTAFIQI